MNLFRPATTSSHRFALSIGAPEGVIFDMDGVVTDTASLHARAWKELFDSLLARRGAAPFDETKEYRLYVDGKPRLDGIRGFLTARSIRVREGTPDDGPAEESVFGLAARKNELFREALARGRIGVFDSTLRLIDALRANGVPTALVSASRNTSEILSRTGLASRFDVTVDGNDAQSLTLRGKPSPDIFVEAARRLGRHPSRVAIVEDSLAGVEAGRRGGFGLVIGIDRSGLGSAFRDRGADVVVRDASELMMEGDRRSAGHEQA